jgi:ferric-dicitrate binding protein FerR (iron transport regulator)
MNRYGPINAALTTRPSERKRRRGSFVLVLLILAVAIVLCVVLTLDASVTADQRIAPSVQSGVSP